MVKRLRETSLTAKRRIVQLVSLVALHSSWGPELKWLCNPVLSCHSCPLAWFACPIGVFIHYSGYHIFPFLALGTVLLLGALIGRLLCGWVCPFGFIQDMLYKLPTPKFHLPTWISGIKYAVLVSMVFLFPFLLGEDTYLSFCRFCPASALEVTVPNLILSGTTTFSLWTGIKLAILLLVLAGVVFSSRAFCKVLCPIGALLAPLNYISLWKIKVPSQNCLTCKACAQVCPQQGNPKDRVSHGVAANRTLDCIVCHECQTICPSQEIEARRRAAAQRPPKTSRTIEEAK